MPIDTRPERASALVVCSRWYPPGLLPDGAITGTDRQQIGWGYIGIPVAPPTPPATGRNPMLYLRRKEQLGQRGWN